MKIASFLDSSADDQGRTAYGVVCDDPAGRLIVPGQAFLDRFPTIRSVLEDGARST